MDGVYGAGADPGIVGNGRQGQRVKEGELYLAPVGKKDEGNVRVREKRKLKRGQERTGGK